MPNDENIFLSGFRFVVKESIGTIFSYSRGFVSLIIKYF